MQRESQKDRSILCKYDPTEPGDYRIEVKWSGENVPGSPFGVMIFDTQDEVNRYVQSHSRNSHSPNATPLIEQRNGKDYFASGSSNIPYSTGFGQMSWRGSTNEL